MLVELILAACTECDRPTFSSCMRSSVAMVTFRFFCYEVNQKTVYRQIELCGY